MFYNDQAFTALLQLMRNEEGDTMGDLAYHLNLIQLLTLCTEGKNVATEIRCHSLLPLDEIVRVVCHQECIPEVRNKTCMLGWARPLRVGIASAACRAESRHS